MAGSHNYFLTLVTKMTGRVIVFGMQNKYAAKDFNEDEMTSGCH
jgi:hypothetical protein